MVRGSLFFGRFDLFFFLFYIYLFYLIAGFNLFILLPLITASRGCCDKRISSTGLTDSGKKKKKEKKKTDKQKLSNRPEG